ncbi:MAG: glycosyltransferase family 4 protein [Bacteroidaceae bacterium]|nr:glycosyltransferase family 4 protein [Bacteroidaceae bacterium]
MRIGIEAQRIFRKNKHGMDYVVLEEIKHLQKMNSEDEYYIFVSPGEDRCIQETKNCHIIEIKCPTYPLWEQIALPLAAKRAKVDLLHCTSNTAPLFCRIPIILTLHDIIFLEPRDKGNKSFYQNLGYYYRKFIVPQILRKCRSIITVSQFEYYTIQQKLGITNDRLRMIYNGYNDWFKPSSEKKKNNAPFLFIGNTDPKKNTERTIIAYSRYLQESKHKRNLVLVDLNDEYLREILKRNKIETIRPYIQQIGYVNNKELAILYQKAFAFLYTSLRESFGIPLLEGMACGTPVITSNSSSMPEIGGKEALLVNPESITDITSMMLQLETDDELYNMQIEYGLERVKHFSWYATAQKLQDVYREFA